MPLNQMVIFTLEEVPAVVYVGQTFSLVIASTATSITSTLQLFCSSALVEDWSDQPVNTLLTLFLSLSVEPNENCYFNTASVAYQIPATSVSVNVSNVALEFTQPTQPTFNQSELIPIEVIAVKLPDLELAINVTWNCSTANYAIDIPMTTSISQSFLVPNDAFGPCTLSANPPPQGFDSPIPVSFEIYWQLRMSDYPSRLYPTQTFLLLIEPTIPAALATSTNVNFVCESIVYETWEDVPFNEAVRLQVSENVPAPLTSCLLRTNTSSPYVIEATSDPISLFQIPMLIATPQSGDIIVAPDNINLLVITPTETLISYEGSAQLTCGISSKNFTYTTNAPQEIGYDENYYGPCSISLLSVPPYFVAPAPVNFDIKYRLSFLNAPTAITIGAPFIINIASSGPTPPSLSEIALNLTCDKIVVQTWNPVPLNQNVTLTVDKNLQPSAFCVFVTVAQTEYFIEAESLVILGFIPSPFGGNLSYISSEEQTQFAQNSSASTAWKDLTFSYL